MKAGLKYCFGIDFGTTNSATVGYVYMDDKYEKILYGDNEQRPIPSVVAIDKENGEIYTGREAWERRIELSETCEFVPSVKSLLGDKDWCKNINGRKWTPELVASEVFKCLQQNVYNTTGITMNDAIVAIPIGFPASKRDIIRNAAALAGINIISFISEPTAAFFANYRELKNDDIVAIFDWGGGTLDISVLRNASGKIFELATGGQSIAGDAIDLKLARKIHAKILRKKKSNISFDDMPARSKDMMIVKAERAKRSMYDDDTATVSINNYGELGAIRETIDYDWFAEVIDKEVNDAIKCLEKVIDESNVGINNIDKIVMVGGSSNLRPLIDKLYNLFGDKLYFPEETMWNVGVGAAMLAATPGDYYTNQEVGIRLSDKTIFPLLKEDVKVKDWSCKHHFGIIDSNLEARLVFAGSSDLDNDDGKYCTLQVPAYKFLQEQIILEANIDKNLILNVNAYSSMRPKDCKVIWRYDRLKCYYKLPKEGGIFD